MTDLAKATHANHNQSDQKILQQSHHHQAFRQEHESESEEVSEPEPNHDARAFGMQPAEFSLFDNFNLFLFFFLLVHCYSLLVGNMSKMPVHQEEEEEEEGFEDDDEILFQPVHQTG